MRSATDYGATCAQPNSALLWFPLVNSGEDCLTLNVWTPTLQPAQKMPVMVWIHGGGFSQGSGNLPHLNDTAIPRQDVVAVTINYRLAMFGFLAHPARRIQCTCGAAGKQLYREARTARNRRSGRDAACVANRTTARR
ncbi:MAG: carboxylesterase family protein, partial [Gammaproteobacteria bacterium]